MPIHTQKASLHCGRRSLLAGVLYEATPAESGPRKDALLCYGQISRNARNPQTPAHFCHRAQTVFPSPFEETPGPAASPAVVRHLERQADTLADEIRRVSHGPTNLWPRNAGEASLKTPSRQATARPRPSLQADFFEVGLEMPYLKVLYAVNIIDYETFIEYGSVVSEVGCQGVLVRRARAQSVRRNPWKGQMKDDRAMRFSLLLRNISQKEGPVSFVGAAPPGSGWTDRFVGAPEALLDELAG